VAALLCVAQPSEQRPAQRHSCKLYMSCRELLASAKLPARRGLKPSAVGHLVIGRMAPDVSNPPSTFFRNIGDLFAIVTASHSIGNESLILLSRYDGVSPRRLPAEWRFVICAQGRRYCLCSLDLFWVMRPGVYFRNLDFRCWDRCFTADVATVVSLKWRKTSVDTQTPEPLRAASSMTAGPIRP